MPETQSLFSLRNNWRLMDVFWAGLVSTLVTIFAVQTKSFWGDEILSLQFASQSVSKLFETLSRDYHPPLYFLLLKAWIGLFGISETALRVFQGMQGFIFLLLALALFKKFLPGRNGRIYWILLTLSGELWLFMPMLRYYIFAASLAIISTLAFEQWLREKNKRSMMMLLFSYIALVYTDYPSSIVILLHLLYTAMSNRQLILKLLAVNIVTLIVFLPWALITLGQIGKLSEATKVADLNTSPKVIILKIVYSLYAFIFGETVFPFEIPVIFVGIGLFVLFLLSLKKSILKENRLNYYPPVFVGLGILFTSLITTFISKHTSFIYTPSRTLFTLPFFILFFAIFLCRAKPFARYGFISLFLLLNVYGISNWIQNRDFMMPVYATPWKEVISDLKGEKGIIISDESLCFEYYQVQSKSVLPELVKTPTSIELKEIIQTKKAQSDPLTVFFLLIGRESTESEIQPDVLTFLQNNSNSKTERKYLALDERYRSLKAKILHRDTYDAKLTLYKFEM